MDSVFSFGDCFSNCSQTIFVHPIVHRVFERPKVLLEQWLENAGHAITRAESECTFQICIQTCSPIPKIPLVIASTEQPLGWFLQAQFSQNKPLYQQADWIWCMDDVDYNYLQTWFEIPSAKMRIVPLMFGTFYVPGNCDAPSLVVRDIDVFQFGTKNTRRSSIMDQLALRKPESKLVYTETMYDEKELSRMLHRTKVVVIPNYYTEPVTLGLHRLAFLLNFPHLIIVAEDAPSSTYVRQLVQWFDRFVFVPYDRLVHSVIAALDCEASDSGDAETKIQSFSKGLLQWKGDVSWLSLVSR